MSQGNQDRNVPALPGSASGDPPVTPRDQILTPFTHVVQETRGVVRTYSQVGADRNVRQAAGSARTVRPTGVQEPDTPEKARLRTELASLQSFVGNVQEQQAQRETQYRRSSEAWLAEEIQSFF